MKETNKHTLTSSYEWEDYNLATTDELAGAWNEVVLLDLGQIQSKKKKKVQSRGWAVFKRTTASLEVESKEGGSKQLTVNPPTTSREQSLQH